jgi:two-component system, sensor histidine kinase and response regulator
MDAKPKILIVDDKPENLVALRTVLKDLDIDLVEAASGNEALKKTLHQDFALALLDIQMPEMDGYELASILREEEKTAHLPFIFISAVYTDNLNVFKGYEKGAFSFITKPFQPEILINKVKFFVEKHQQEIELFQLYKSLEKKNEELEYSNKELESFSYSVSHDLRAPLRALLGYSEILSEDYNATLDEEGRELIGKIRKGGLRMERLIEDLLLFSKMGKRELSMTEVNMKQLVEKVVEDFPGTTAKITISPLPSVSGDSSLLQQVWVNLVSNAIKYSSGKPEPRIEISATTEGNMVTYAVKDNGAGFNMKYADKLFGVFQRLHGKEFEGTGIGLATAQRIIKKHGGKIWAEAKENEGATFFFSLPTHTRD